MAGDESLESEPRISDKSVGSNNFPEMDKDDLVKLLGHLSQELQSLKEKVENPDKGLTSGIVKEVSNWEPRKGASLSECVPILTKDENFQQWLMVLENTLVAEGLGDIIDKSREAAKKYSQNAKEERDSYVKARIWGRVDGMHRNVIGDPSLDPLVMVERLSAFRRPKTLITQYSSFKTWMAFKWDSGKGPAENLAEFEKYRDDFLRFNIKSIEDVVSLVLIGALPSSIRNSFLDSLPVELLESGKIAYDDLRARVVERASRSVRKEQNGNSVAPSGQVMLVKGNEKSGAAGRKRKPFGQTRKEGDDKSKPKRPVVCLSTPDGKCIRCLKPGHDLKACKQSLPTCYSCLQETNHKAFECPNRGRVSSGRKTGGNGRANMAGEDLVGFHSTGSDEGEYIHFVLDSGATDHLTYCRTVLQNIKYLDRKVKIKCANGENLTFSEEGDLCFSLEVQGVVHSEIIEGILLSSSVSENLLSLRRIVEAGNEVLFKENIVIIRNNQGVELMRGKYTNNMYKLSFRVLKEMTGKAFLGNLEGTGTVGDSEMMNNAGASTSSLPEKVTDLQKENGWLWHRKLGHSSQGYLKKLVGQFSELKGVKFVDEIRTCNECLKGEFTRLPCNQKRERATCVLQIVHSDLVGPLPKSYGTKKRWFVSFVDDFSRYATVFSMEFKSDTSDAFKQYIAATKREQGLQAKISVLRCDSGGEYTSEALKEVCKQEGIEIEMSECQVPQHNGTSERFNRTIMKMVRTALFDSMLPSSFWDYALGASTFVYNHLPHSACKFAVPISRWLNKNPSLEYIRRFGCLLYFYNTDKNAKKLDAKGLPGIFIGYQRTGCVVYNPQKGQIFRATHVRCVENKVYGDVKDDMKIFYNGIKQVSETEDGLLWLNSSDLALAEEAENWSTEVVNKRAHKRTFSEMENEQLSLENEERCVLNSETGVLKGDTQSHKSEEVEGADSDDFSEIIGIEEECIESDDESYAHAFLSCSDGEPTTFKEAMKHPDCEKWTQAMNVEFQAMAKAGVWKLVDRPKRGRVMGSRWVYKIKYVSDAPVRYRARLVSQGFLDKPRSKVETYAPVVRDSSYRTIFAIANKFGWKLHQLDITTAFLNGELEEEILMEIPEGYENWLELRKTKVCCLQRAIYGLKVSPKIWNDRFHAAMQELKLVRDIAEPCIYTAKGEGHKVVILTVYVDDILLTGNWKEKIKEIREKLSSEFEVKYLGQPKKFLGISVSRDLKGHILSLNQKEYIEGLVEKFKCKNLKNVSTPYSSAKEALTEVLNWEGVFPFRSLLGALLFVARATRPDINFAVNLLSRNQSDPSVEDCVKALRVLQYLKGTSDIGLRYTGSTNEIDGFADADFAGNKEDRKSTTGSLVRLFGDLVYWKSKKQGCVARSSTEAEYVALSETSRELVAIRNLVGRILKPFKYPSVIYEDNESTKMLVYTEEMKGLRHIEVSYHFIKEQVKNKVVELKSVRSSNQLADILTKELINQVFTGLREKVLSKNY